MSSVVNDFREWEFDFQQKKNLGTTITFDESLFGQTIILNGSELYIGNIVMTNSTVAKNNAGGIYTFGGTMTINNSVIAQNALDDIYRLNLMGPGTIQGNYNLTTFTDWSSGGNNIAYDSAKPLSADAANSDYRLASGSQAVNAGSNQPAYNAGLSAKSF